MHILIQSITLLLFHLSQAEYPSDILECSYSLSSYHSDSNMLLTIEGYKFRETICKANSYSETTCHFAIPVKNRNLNVSYFIDGYINDIPKLSCNYHHGIIIDKKLGYQDKLIKNKEVKMLQAEYYYPKRHILNIATLISLRPLDFQQSPAYLKIYLNTEPILEDVLYPDYPFHSDKLEVYGNNGFNNIDLIIDSYGNWCSCPSIGNGFENNRYLLAWITNLDDNKIIKVNDKYIINIMDRQIVSI